LNLETLERPLASQDAKNQERRRRPDFLKFENIGLFQTSALACLQALSDFGMLSE
jgi:hypothetical protein